MTNNDTDSRINFFQENVAIVRYQLAELTDENAALRARLDEANRSLAILKDEIGPLRHAHSRLISNLNTSTGSRSDNLEATISAMLNSTSWRVTKPLRWIKTRLTRG